MLGVVLAAVTLALAPARPDWIEGWYSTTLYPRIERTLTPISNRLPIALLDPVIILAVVVVVVAAGVALFQRLFVAVTGDRSDGAVVITTLILAGLFTPVKNGLQGFVDQRFKPAGSTPHMDVQHEIQTVEQRLAQMEERLQRLEGPDSTDRDSA